MDNRGRVPTDLKSEDGGEVVDRVPCGELDEEVIASVLDAAVEQLGQESRDESQSSIAALTCRDQAVVCLA